MQVMDLMGKIQHDLSEGISILRKEGTSLFLKTMTEVDMLKFRYDLHKVGSQLSDFYRELGERFTEAIVKKDHGFLSKQETKDLIERIDTVRIDEEKYKKELDDLRDLQKDKGG